MAFLELKRLIRPATGVALATLAIAAAGPATGQPPDSRRDAPLKPSAALLSQGNAAFQQGNLEAALRAYEEARAEATKRENTTDCYDACLRAGQVRQAQAAKIIRSRDNSKAAALLRAAAADFNSVIESGNSLQKAEAANSLGLLHLQSQDYGQAVATLQAIRPEHVEEAQRWVLYFNLARAYDLKGEAGPSFDSYLKSFRSSPYPPAAADRAFALLYSGRVPESIPKARALALEMLDRKQGTLAARCLIAGLKGWGADPAAETLLVPLVRYYATSLIEPSGFLAEEWPRLEPLGKSHPKLAPGLNEIRASYVEDFKATLPSWPGSRLESVAGFPYWSRQDDQGRAAMSALLQRVGESYASRLARPDKLAAAKHVPTLEVTPRKAWARLATAWAFDPTNSEAALGCALVLSDHSATLDPDHRLYENWTDRMFEGKARAYALEFKTADDWWNILRMHSALGMAFEREKAWGNEGLPRSAIFQWSLALRAEENVHRIDPERPRTPGIRLHLADAYKGAKRLDESYDQYLAAADIQTAIGQFDDAADTIARAKALPGVEMTDARRKLLARVESKRLQEIKLDLQKIAIAHHSTKFAKVLLASGWLDAIEQDEKPYTIFLPTDAAFAELPTGTFEAMLKPENKPSLSAFMAAHILEGKTTIGPGIAGEKIRDIRGDLIPFRLDDGQVKAGEAKVETGNIPFGKGMLHSIDRPLLRSFPVREQ